MNEIDFEKRFNKMFSNNEIAELENLAIFQNTKNEYQVFKRYYVIKSTDGVEVQTLSREAIHSFSTMKHAICWCIFDKRGKYMTSNRIIDLDRKLSGFQVNTILHKKLFKTAKDNDTKLIYLAKLNEDRLQRKSIQNELDFYIRDSYSWQQRIYSKTE